MISNLILLGASGLFVGGIYFSKKQKFYTSIFDDLRKSKSYHMDYVEDITHLPLNKYIILFGPAISLNRQKYISPCFIQKSNSKDRLWTFSLKDDFNLETSSKQKIVVEGSPREKIVAFNLPPTNRQLRQQKFEERAIINNVGVCCYGRLSDLGGVYKFKPKVIVGNKQQSLLMFLDEHIVNLNRKGKLCAGVGFSIVALHAFYRFVISKPKKTQIQIDIEKQKKR